MKSSDDQVVRIKDIAKKAGVSVGTVDRVIHKRSGVAAKSYNKVMKALKEMDYEPNVMARVLVSKKTYRIAALIPDARMDSYWAEPREGIAKAANDMKQYSIRVTEHIFDPTDKNSFIEKANEVTQLAPDGILVSPIFYSESLPFLEKWKEMGISIVLFNTQISEFAPLSYIGQDSYQSGLLAGKLIHYGQHKPSTIAIMHIDEDVSNSAHLQKKEKGFRNYFKHNNLNEQFNIVSVQANRSNPAGFTKVMDELVEDQADLRSIFVTTCKAYEVAKYLEQRHIHHLTLVGYDLLPPNFYFLEKGRIDFLINQNARTQGYLGIYELTQHLVFRRPVQEIRYLPLDVVTKENMNYFVDKENLAIMELS